MSRAKTTNEPAPQTSSLTSGTIGPGLLASLAATVSSVCSVAGAAAATGVAVPVAATVVVVVAAPLGDTERT